MGFNYRCTIRRKCGKCRTLKHPLEWYIRTPKCKACGGKLSPDPHVKRHNMARVCRCKGFSGREGYPYPHRKGLVIDENNFCHSLTLQEVQVILDNRELGAVETHDGGEDIPCPF